VAAVAGWRTTLSYPLTALARAVLPASLVHLAFVFPRTREVAVRVPGIHRVGYGIALGLLLLELNATYRGSFSTMLLVQRIEMVATAVAVILLCFSCWLSMRESPSRLARGQARVFLIGLGLLLAATLGGSLLEVSGGSLTAVTLGAALSPLPLGFAIARYHLFDLGISWRRTIAHVVYLSIWSGLFFVGVVSVRDQLPIPDWLRHPMVILAGVCLVLVPLDLGPPSPEALHRAHVPARIEDVGAAVGGPRLAAHPATRSGRHRARRAGARGRRRPELERVPLSGRRTFISPRAGCGKPGV
jgi:hypothetical protein